MLKALPSPSAIFLRNPGICSRARNARSRRGGEPYILNNVSRMYEGHGGVATVRESTGTTQHKYVSHKGDTFTCSVQLSSRPSARSVLHIIRSFSGWIDRSFSD